MEGDQSFSRQRFAVSLQRSDFNASTSFARDDDADLLALKTRFDELVGELWATQPRDIELAISPDQEELAPDVELAGIGDGTRMQRAEAVLARLYPIEQAIVQTQARTTAGLGVKASHAAYVMSEYWEAPIDQLDWDARTIRLLIEAVCKLTGTPLPVSERTIDV